MEGWRGGVGVSKVALPQCTAARAQHARMLSQTCTRVSGCSQRPSSLPFFSHPRSVLKAPQSSHARTHARTHACMSACNVFFLHSYYVSIYVSLRRFLVPAQFLWKIFPSITATKGIAAIKGSSEPTDPHGAEKGHFGW